ncbi:MAG: signal peptide peptidase SppA [Chloroflexota bacterium]
MTTASSESTDKPSDQQHKARDFGRSIGDRISTVRMNFRNWRRSRKDAYLDYIVVPLGGSFPERDDPPRNFIERRLPLPSPPLSMQGFNRRMQRIAEADNVGGVVFILQNLSVGLGTLQNLRQAIGRLRATGKEVVVYTPYLDMRHYYIASAADRIVAPPSTKFDAVGLYTEVTFLKDALARIGVSVDVIQISPYKTAFDRLGQSDLTPEYREQLSWLLDEQYDILTGAMASGRSMTQEDLQELIDRSPLSLEEALTAGLIDNIAYDDELPSLLASTEKENKQGTNTDAPANPPQAKMQTWSEGNRLLLEIHHKPTRKFIGVISLEGTIAMGPSRTPPIDVPIPFVGGSSAGEQTLVRLLRQAEKQEDMAALIFHIDSGGGSALASDLIGRQVALLARKKPVLVYMGNIAASGGYYVAAPAQHIMSQIGTVTGSIGVITAHVTASGLYDMLAVNQTSLQRGDHANIYTDTGPLSEEARSIYWRDIVHTYEQFKDVVANGRNLPRETLDPICEGRVWTGRQAKDLNLVDSHGDFLDAIRQAAVMADLPTDDIYAISVVNLFPKNSSYVLPRNEQKAWLNQISELAAGDTIREWNGRPLALLPFDLRFR